MRDCANATGRSCRGLVSAAVAAWLLWPAVAEAGRLFVVTRANRAEPHVACVFEYDGGQVVWLHFRPVAGSMKKVVAKPVPGVLDAEGFDTQINHLVGFDVPDAMLRDAEQAALERFATGTDYELYQRDCVSLAVFVCQECRLRVKADHFAPKSLVQYLRKHNAYTDEATNLDHKKNTGYVVPWRVN